MSLSSDPSIDHVHRPLSRFGQFSVLLVAFVWIFEASAVAPILGQLEMDFPGTSTLKLQLVLSAVFFTSIGFSVVAGALARRFDRKRSSTASPACCPHSRRASIRSSSCGC